MYKAVLLYAYVHERTERSYVRYYAGQFHAGDKVTDCPDVL